MRRTPGPVREDRRVEGHLDHHGGERLRHERQHLRIVVAQVVAPAERVVDAASVGARARFLRSCRGIRRTGRPRSWVLQQSCPVKHATGGDAGDVEVESRPCRPGRTGSWLSPIESKYSIAWSRATFDGSYTCGGNVRRDRPGEEVDRGRVEDADDVVRCRGDVGVEVVADLAELARAQVVDVVLRSPTGPAPRRRTR